MKISRHGEYSHDWVPSFIYAVCFFILDYKSGIRTTYIETPVDYLWTAPAGMATILILPPATCLYAGWLNKTFGIPDNPRFKVNFRLLSDILPWLTAIFLCVIDRPLTAYTLLAGIIWSLGGLLRRISNAARQNGTRLTRTREYIAVLFFISGFSALIYQIVWQRVLFTAFGVDSESITIIVSVFMFGLGIGALAGSWLVKFRGRLLRIFLLAEIGIGIFGFFSLPLTRFLIAHVTRESDAGLALICYILFAI